METVHHDEVGHYVHHDAVTHIEYIEHPEISHEEYGVWCTVCGANMGNTQDSIDAHIDYHDNRGESIGYVKKTKKIVDQAAWDEQVKVVDKAAWSEQVKVVDKEAWTETIVDKEAYDEKIKVIDKAAYDETIKQKVCSICGKIQK